MTCERAREHIIELDARSAPTGALEAHIRSCGACRAFLARMQRVEAAARLGTGTPGHAEAETARRRADFTARVMEAVTAEAAASFRPASEPTPRPVGLRGWTAGGTLILAGLVAIEFSDVVEWLRATFGSVIDVALSTMLGVALTIYIMLLVGLNLPAVRRFLRLRVR
ncbi:MAG: hypothetical protein ACOC7V_12930 [Spirochaetota bacterium]